MSLQHFLLLSVILCVEQVCSLPRCKLQRRLVETCHHLLESMGGAFPLQCLKDSVSVPFPKAAFESSTTQQTLSIEKTVYRTLQYIESLFNKDALPDQWTALKEMDKFHHVVFRLVEENRCIMNKTQNSVNDFLSREASLRAYFNKTAAVLKEKNFRYCAWELVRTEIVSALQFILNKDFESRPRRALGRNQSPKPLL